jgi:hypothetical protein
VIGAEERTQLNLFLYQIAQNRNADWIAHKRGGDRFARTDTVGGASPPLALNLHYLLTAYGTKDFQCELLLGYAMQLFHDASTLDLNTIQAALKHAATVNPSGVFAQALTTNRVGTLAEQLGTIKLSPEFFNTEEMSKLWSVLQAPYRPSIAYEVSMVLIESDHPISAAHPVGPAIASPVVKR